MSLNHLFIAIRTPKELFATYNLFRDFGASWSQALKHAVDCVVSHQFILL